MDGDQNDGPEGGDGGAEASPPSPEACQPVDASPAGSEVAAASKTMSAQGSAAAPPGIYVAPTMRPCSSVQQEGRGQAPAQLRAVLGTLTADLPLLGAASMRPVPGGIMLTECLRDRLPWMEEAIASIERGLRLALWAGRPWLAWRPLCLIGPPGIGKSHLATEIGRISRVPSVALDLGAMHDAGALVSVSQAWSNAKPCWPAEVMSAHRCANPILVLDEVEKAGGSRRNGDPLKALLGMLEPSTARTYFDTALMAELDLSAVCWICTANEEACIPAALASRMDLVHLPAPSLEHFPIVLDQMLGSMATRWAVAPTSMPVLPDRARDVLRAVFERQRSFRALAPMLERVMTGLIIDGQRQLH